MRLSAPKQLTFFLSLVVAGFALLDYLGIIRGVGHSFAIMAGAWLVLAAGCLMDGM